MIRPRPARWFEALVARDDATLALEALAATGAIELESRPSASLPAALADLRPLMARYAELARRFEAYWPSAGFTPSAFPEPPAVVLERDLARIRAWAAEAEPLIAELQALAAESRDIAVWQRALAALHGSPLALDRLAGDGEVRTAKLIAFPPGPLPAVPPQTLLRGVDIGGETHFLAVGPAPEVDALGEAAIAAHGRSLPPPAWLLPLPEASLAFAATRLDAIGTREEAIRRLLDALAQRHDLATALGDGERLQWVIDNVRALESGEHFCLVTGWTSAGDRRALTAALDVSGARAILHFPPPPEGLTPPLLFANPAWARPFEIFARVLGTPSRDEVDPSTLLALLVPLMFGYMFGDVGQGLVIAAVGFALRKRYPLARLYISGGLCAAAFGLVFGSAFSIHGLHALWVQPLERPLDVLVVPIVAGAALLTLGLVLSGLEAWWREAFGGWLATEAPIVAVYVGILAGIARPDAFALAAAGVIAACAGGAWQARRWTGAAAALAELVERTLQLLINTLSFARVGAFALAHAGLSSAIVVLMDAADSLAAKALVLVAGNVVVIVLETLVVSIQTTRLVLFEFFTRFLRAAGRTFRPLPLPPLPH